MMPTTIATHRGLKSAHTSRRAWSGSANSILRRSFIVTCFRATSRFAKPTWRCWSHPTGLTSYLHTVSRRRRSADTAGVQHLLWATDTESDLQEFAQRPTTPRSSPTTKTE